MHRSRVGLDAQKPGLARELHKARFRACHEKKLAEISRRAPGTGTLDNRAPYTANLVHLKTRPKKKAILAARDAEVERANRDLLRQMTRIFTKPSALVPACNYVDGGGNGGRGREVTCASINVMCRKRELERIALENKHLVKHLGAVSSSYDVAVWEKDRTANRKIMERLRTVRFERRKTAPQEFSRRGVRHLRKQVEQTRGQAFEAGFAPVPRLFSSAKVARRARPETNGRRRPQPGKTSPSREHRVLRGGLGRKRGRRDRDLKLRRSSSERAAEFVRVEDATATSGHTKCIAPNHAEGGVIDGSGGVISPRGCEVADGISVSVRQEAGSGELAAVVACDGGGSTGQEEQDEEEYSEFADDDNERVETGGAMGSELQENQDGEEEEQEQYSEFEYEYEEGSGKSYRNDDDFEDEDPVSITTQDMSSSPPAGDSADQKQEVNVDKDQEESPVGTAPLAERGTAGETTPSGGTTRGLMAHRDDTAATTTGAKQPPHPSEADKMTGELYLNPASSDASESRMGGSDAVAVNHTAMVSPRGGDGLTVTVSETQQEPTATGGTATATATAASGAVVSKQTPAEYSENSAIRERWVGKPSGEHAKQPLEAEGGTESGEQPAVSGETLNETSGVLSKEISAETPKTKFGGAVDRVPAAVDAPGDEPRVELEPISGAKSDGEHHQGGFRDSPAPAAIPPFGEDCDASFPLSGKSEETAYSEFGDTEDVDEKGSAEVGSICGGSDDGKGQTGHGRRGEFERKNSSHSDDHSKGTGTGRGQSLVGPAEGSKEGSFDGGGGNIGEDSGAAPGVFGLAAEDETAVSAPPQRTSEENAGYIQEGAEKPAVVNGGNTTAGNGGNVVDGCKPEIVAKVGERFREKHGQVVEELDEAPATEGERQEDKSGAVMPDLASSNSTGDGSFEAQRLDATEQGSGKEVIPLETPPVFEADAAMDTEGPKKEGFNDNATLSVTTDESIHGGDFRAEGTEAAGIGPAEKNVNIPEGATVATDTEATNRAGDTICDETAAVGSADHDSLDAENALAEATSGSEGNVVGESNEGAAVVSGATEATEAEGGSVESGVSPTHHRVSKTSSAGEAYVERETLAGSGGEFEEANDDENLVVEGKELTGAASKEAMDEGSKATATGIEWGKGGRETADPGVSADNYVGYDSFEADSTEGKAGKTLEEINADPPENVSPAAVDVEEPMEEEKANVVNGATVGKPVAGHSFAPANAESTGSGSHLNNTPAANGERTSALAQPSARGTDSAAGTRVEYSADGDSLAAESTGVAVGDGAPRESAMDSPEGEGNCDGSDDAKGDAKASLDTAEGATTVGDAGQLNAVDRTEGAPKDPWVLTLEGGDAAAGERTPSTREAESMLGGEMGPPVGNSSFEPKSVEGKMVECEEGGAVVDPKVSGDISAVEEDASGVVMIASGATVASSIGGSGLDDESTGATEINPPKDVGSDVSKADNGRDNGGAEAEEAGTPSGEATDKCTIGDSFEAESLDETGSVSEKPPLPKGDTPAGAKVGTGTDAGEECESNSRAGADNSADHSSPEPESTDGVGASDVASTAGGGGSNPDYQVCSKTDIAGETVGAVSTMVIPGTAAAPAPETAEAVPAPSLEKLGATSTASALPQSDLASEGPEEEEQTDQPFDPEPATESALASPPVGGNDLRVEVVPGDAALGQLTETLPSSGAQPAASSFSSADLIVEDGEGGNSEPVLLSREDEGDNVDVTPASERAGAENAKTNAAASLPSGGSKMDDLTIVHLVEHDGGAGDAAESPSTPSADRDEVGDSGTVTALVSGAIARNTTTVDGEESKVEPSVLDAPFSQEDAGGSSVSDTPTVEDLCHQAGSENAAVDAGSIDNAKGVECATIGGHDECAEPPTHSEEEQGGIAAGATAATGLPQSSLENQVDGPRTATVDAVGGDNPAVTGDDDTVAPGGELSSGNSNDTTPLLEPSHFSSTSAVDSGHYGAQVSERPAPDAASCDPSSEPPVGQVFQPGDRVEEERGDGGGEVEAREGAGSRIEPAVGAGSDGGQRQNEEDDDCYAMFDNASSSLESLGSSDPPVVVGPSEDVEK